MKIKRTPEIDHLFAEVYANPDDDDARFVLSDALIEAGHPWGHLIALQYGRARKGGSERSEQKLLRQCLDVALGPIKPCLYGYTFERGFISAAHVAANRIQREMLEAREWSTVRSLELLNDSELIAPLVLSTPIRSFTRRVVGLTREHALEVLSSSAVRRYEHLSIDASNARQFVQSLELATPVNMPRLRELEIALPTPGDARRAPPPMDRPLIQRLLSCSIAPWLSYVSVTSRNDNSALSGLAAVNDLVTSKEPVFAGKLLLEGQAGRVTIELADRDKPVMRVEVGVVRYPNDLARALDALILPKPARVRVLLGRGEYVYARSEQETTLLETAAARLGEVAVELFP